MNKVFEHAGDLVNLKVAHNLMRLIAEGFGEDDDTADTQLRSSAVRVFNFLLRLVLNFFSSFNGYSSLVKNIAILSLRFGILLVYMIFLMQ